MLERMFKLTERETSVKQEVIGGLTTFMTMSYIIFVNPSIMADTGMDKGALITITCLSAAIGSLIAAFWANAPLGLSVLDLVNTFMKVNNVKIPYELVERRAGDVATCYANSEKALKELNWKTEKNLEDMCRDSWKWQSNNPEGY